MPDETPRRRFTLIDLMGLAAAPAASLEILRLGFITPDSLAQDIGDDPTVFATTTIAALAPATVALAWMRLRQPRPGVRGLLDRPGAVALFAAGAALLEALADTGLRALNPDSTFGYHHLASQRIQFCVHLIGSEAVAIAGFGVALCWALMAASGRWRAEPTWIDRAGRALGVAWIAAAAAFRYVDHG